LVEKKQIEEGKASILKIPIRTNLNWLIDVISAYTHFKINEDIYVKVDKTITKTKTKLKQRA